MYIFNTRIFTLSNKSYYSKVHQGNRTAPVSLWTHQPRRDMTDCNLCNRLFAPCLLWSEVGHALLRTAWAFAKWAFCSGWSHFRIRCVHWSGRSSMLAMEDIKFNHFNNICVYRSVHTVLIHAIKDVSEIRRQFVQVYLHCVYAVWKPYVAGRISRSIA